MTLDYDIINNMHRPNHLEDVGYRNVEIRSAFTHRSPKDMARDTPGSPMSRPRDLAAGATAATLTSGAFHASNDDSLQLHEHGIKKKFLEQHHELQKQLLLQQYQAQERHLAEIHEQRLQQLQWEEKKKLEIQEKERIDALRKKDKHDHSAIASTEVKQRLQDFIVNKKQREAAALANGGPGTSGHRNW